MTIKKIKALSFGSFFIAGAFCCAPVEGIEKTIKEDGLMVRGEIDDQQDSISVDPKSSKIMRTEYTAEGYRVKDLRTDEVLVYDKERREAKGTNFELIRKIAFFGTREKDSSLNMQVQFKEKIPAGLLTTLKKQGCEISQDQKTVFVKKENITRLLDFLLVSRDLSRASPKLLLTGVNQDTMRKDILYGDGTGFSRQFKEQKEKEHVSFTRYERATYEGAILTVLENYEDGSLLFSDHTLGYDYLFDHAGRVFTTNGYRFGKEALDILNEKKADVGTGVNLKIVPSDNDKDLVAYFKKANIHYDKTQEGSFVIKGLSIRKAQAILDYVGQFRNLHEHIESEIKDLSIEGMDSLKMALEGHLGYSTAGFYSGQRDVLLAPGSFENFVGRNEILNAKPGAPPIRLREGDVFRGDDNPVLDLPVGIIQTDAAINPENSGSPLVNFEEERSSSDE